MGNWNGIETFNWMGFEWIKRPYWGTNHEEIDFTYYDEKMTSIDKNNNMVVDFHYNPKVLPMKDGIMVDKPYGIGCCRTTQEFKYGTFEWEMRCPYGNYLWPALWMASDASWPPEIDCMEGWSDMSKKYVKNLIFRNIHPTMHWTKNGEHIQEGKNNILTCQLKCGDNFDKYKVVWTPKFVKIYYNNNLIKTYKNKDMLDHFNKPEIKFHAIMSSGPYKPFSSEDYNDYLKNNKPMLIKSFKYLPF